MEDLNAKGGSYERQEDRSLKLVSRTADPEKPEAVMPTKSASKAVTARKEN